MSELTQRRIVSLRQELAELEAKQALESAGWHETFDDTQRAYWIHPDYDGCRFYEPELAQKMQAQTLKLLNLSVALEILFRDLPNPGSEANSLASIKALVYKTTSVEISTDQLLKIAEVLYDATSNTRT